MWTEEAEVVGEVTPGELCGEGTDTDDDWRDGDVFTSLSKQ